MAEWGGNLNNVRRIMIYVSEKDAVLIINFYSKYLNISTSNSQIDSFLKAFW